MWCCVLKRVGNLYETICSFDNIYSAYLEARKGKKKRREVLRFRDNLEENLVSIQNDLINKTYTMGKYHELFVHDPKKRLIMSLPFRDRIVQWAIYRVLNPILDARYINSSFGCRNGYGSHRAVKYLQSRIRRSTSEQSYVLKMDVSKYFYRIDHKVLFNMLSGVIKDKELMWLLKLIIFSEKKFGINIKDHDFTKGRVSGIGIPIGNLTSQMFANFFLNSIDQYAKNELKVKNYVRYMDDICITSDNKNYLRYVLHNIDLKIKKLLLVLNNRTTIRSVKQGVDFCGYRVWKDHIRLRKKTSVKMKRRIKSLQRMYSRWDIDLSRFNNSLQSFLGTMSHCDSFRLRRKILNNIVLVRMNKHLIV